MNYTDVKNPQWANPEKTAINCEVNFSHIAEEFVPFTATPDDFYAHGREIYDLALSGQIGEIADYQPPPEPTEEQKAFLIRQNRDNALKELDAIVSNPLRWNSYSDTQKSQVAQYRQALLDIPQQAGFPNTIDWPSLSL